MDANSSAMSSVSRRELIERRLRAASGRHTAQLDTPVLVVGYIQPLQQSLDERQGTRSVVFVDEPDVALGRGAPAHLRTSTSVRELIPFEYQLPGAVDAFLARYPEPRPSAVIPGMEYAVPFAARLAERYGLPGAGPLAADTLRDKHSLRTVTGAAGLSNPRSRLVDGPEAVRIAIADEGGAVVLKPANRQGSLGTRILMDPSEVDEAWAECTVQDEGPFVPQRGLPLRMLAEQYIEGDEYSVELLVRDGVSLFANVTGKVLFPGPRPVERGHVVPAPLPQAQAELLIGETRRVLAAIGFGTGFVHCEWILSGDTPFLVECAGRLPGDGIVELISRAWQLDIVGLYLSLMQGQSLPGGLPRQAPRGAAVWFLHSEPGEVIGVEGTDQAAGAPDVVRVAVTAEPGSAVKELRSSNERVGAVTACSVSGPDALRRAQEAAAAIQVRTSAMLAEVRR